MVAPAMKPASAPRRQAEGSGHEADGSAALVALAFAAAGIGFAAYVYLVPYQGLLLELKRRASDNMSVQTAAETRLKELDRLKFEVAELRSANNVRAGGGGGVKPELKFLKAQFDERLKDAGITVDINDRKLVLHFPEKTAFENSGAPFSSAGQAALQAVKEIMAGHPARMIILAPIPAGQPPRWVVDLASARVRAAVRLLLKFGVSPQSLLAVSTGGPTAPASGPPTLDIEIEPQG